MVLVGVTKTNMKTPTNQPIGGFTAADLTAITAALDRARWAHKIAARDAEVAAHVAAQTAATVAALEAALKAPAK